MYFMIFHVLVCWRESDQLKKWCLILMYSPYLPFELVSSWPRLQNGDKMLCVEPLDSQHRLLVDRCNTEKNPKLVKRILNPKCDSWLSIVLYVFIIFYQLHHDHQHPHQSSIIDHIMIHYHNHVCHYNRHLVVSTLRLICSRLGFPFSSTFTISAAGFRGQSWFCRSWWIPFFFVF